MLDGILDEDLDDRQEKNHFGAKFLGRTLIFLGIFLLWNSYHDSIHLIEKELSFLVPPSWHGIIFSLSLATASVINGFLLYLKNTSAYYLLIGIISGIFTYCTFLIKDNTAFIGVEILEAITEGIFESLFLLILNIIFIIFSYYHKEKILNTRLFFAYIFMGIIIGSLPFLIRDLV